MSKTQKILLDPKRFRRLLLNWYDCHGRKNLPWQKDKSPYRVWISEIMLQQTQVATVIPYFQRFMTTFPSLKTLATAPEEMVLHLWSGLGYYSRARNLHKTAKIIMQDHAGIFPRTHDALINLPGIGPSTANAILSIAFGKPTPILDGNVKRVLCRFQAIDKPPSERETESLLWEIATHFMSKTRPADYTQAIMDLGATCCTRSKPNCTACPLQTECLAYKRDCVAELPVKKIKRTLPLRKKTLIILTHGKKVLLYKRPSNGVWGSLWSLPEIPGIPHSQRLKTWLLETVNNENLQYHLLPSFRHTFTHFHLDIFPVLVKVKKMAVSLNDIETIWYDRARPPSIGLPKPIKEILGHVLRT